MSLRLPQNLDPATVSDRAIDAFHQEVLAEKAASLGRAGNRLAAALNALGTLPNGPARTAAVRAAADAAHGYFIQRELCGLYAHQPVIDDYGIPREVLAQVGAL